MSDGQSHTRVQVYPYVYQNNQWWYSRPKTSDKSDGQTHTCSSIPMCINTTNGGIQDQKLLISLMEKPARLEKVYPRVSKNEDRHDLRPMYQFVP